MSKTVILNLQNITFTYLGTTRPAIENVNINISQGEFVVLTGESGCGKATIARLINGLIPHFFDGKLEGKVFLDGKDTAAMKIHDISNYVGSEMAFSCENMGMSR